LSAGDAQNYRGRAAVRKIAEGDNSRVPFQDCVDDFTLHADASAVNDADLAETAPDSLKQVLFHDNFDFSRLERVEIDAVFDRNLVHSIKYNRRL